MINESTNTPLALLLKNTLINQVAWRLGIRQATIKHFCYDFSINYHGQVSHKIKDEYEIAKDYLNPAFVSYLTKNNSFLIKYENDYYSDKTPEIIVETVNQDINAINKYLELKYPKYYINGKFTPLKKYSLRYVSSYFIDYELGGNYEFLNKF